MLPPASVSLFSASVPPSTLCNSSVRVLQASYLIPSYQKALPHALLHKCSDDFRLRKIETTCSCKISWGRLPARLAERYCLLQLAFDSRRGNFLGALNLLRQYFLGHMALIPFQQTLLRPDGSQVTKKFPTSLDDCRLLTPRCDRFGRASADLAAEVAAAEYDRAAAMAHRSEACRQLGDSLVESGLRCLAMHAAFVVESEARHEAAAAEKADRAAAEELAAKAADAKAQLACAAETVAQCELCRTIVCALVEAVESTRLLEQLDSRHWSVDQCLNQATSISFTQQHQQQLLHRRRQRRLRSRHASRPRYRRRINFHLSPAPQHQGQDQEQQQVPAPTMRQENNHHRPAGRARDRQRHQEGRLQPTSQSHSRNQEQNNQEESCATTLADVEAITFAESEYVDNHANNNKLATVAPQQVTSSGRSASSPEPQTTPPPKLPESLLLCGIRPNVADALCAFDRTDRRLKAVERRTGCRLQLRERLSSSGDASYTTVGAGAGATCLASHQVRYAIQVTPLYQSSRPLGCVNMLRTLLHRLDPACRVCVLTASEVAAGARNWNNTVTSPPPQQPPSLLQTPGICQSKLAMTHHRTMKPHRYQLCPQQPSLLACTSLAQMQSSAVADTADRLLYLAIADCLLGASATVAAVAADTYGGAFCHRLELRREVVLGDALVCVFRSLTANEADARLLGEAMDNGGEDSGIVMDAVHRTLITCAAERYVGSGLLGAFACLRSPDLPVASAASSMATLSSVTTTSDATLLATASLITMSVRRRLAQLVMAVWERLCTESLCSGAQSGAGILLEAVVVEAAASVALSQLTMARLALSFCRQGWRRRPQPRQHPVSFACAANAEDAVSSDDDDDDDYDTDGSSVERIQRGRRHRHRERHKSLLGWQLRRAAFRGATVHDGLPLLARRSSGPSSVLAVRRLLADLLEAAVDERLTVGASLTWLAADMVSEQVWNACVEAQAAMRLRLRTS